MEEKRSRFQIIWMAVLYIAVFALTDLGFAEEPAQRKLTLMVYMCGSNLESQYGLAYADIEEMRASGVDPEAVNMLLLTGGSTYWHTGQDTDTVEVRALKHSRRSGENRWTTVQTLPSRSMGNAQTLADFLDWGVLNYPAEKYALILWDHGGGPLEGVCWDETYAMDHLSMAELTEALGMVKLEKPLSFIGFDTCLMGSLEVAKQISPYADYMIASQEMEPSSGWNYSFLKGIERNLSAAETGRRIVDCYMESQNPREVLTLSCIDLNKVDLVLQEMNSYFAALGARMNIDSFAKISGLRMNSTGFGKSVPGFRSSGEDGYDLVDLMDLVNRLDENGKYARKLQEALSECVVYSRSNEENVHGLSIYHPLTNKAQYLSEWGEKYQTLDFSRGYQRYVDSFARILTGEEFIDWNGLELIETGRDEEGRPSFVAPLTEAQEQGFAHAQLLILQKTDFSTEQNQTFRLIGSSPAWLEDRQIQSVYDGNILIADVDNGKEQIPVSYLLSDDGRKMMTATVYVPLDSTLSSSETLHAWFELSRDEESGQPIIDQVLVHDKVTDVLSARIPLIEENYHQVLFWNQLMKLPKGEGILQSFNEWDSPDEILVRPLELPADWSFKFLKEGLPGQQLYVTLQVTDVQHNTMCTQPIPISDDRIVNFELSDQTVETDAYRLTLKGGSFYYSEDNPGLKFYLQAENLTDREISIELAEGRINGTRKIGDSKRIRLEMGEKDIITIPIDSSSLYGISSLNSFGYDEVAEGALYGEKHKQYPKIEFKIPGVSTGEFGEYRIPLAEEEQNRVYIALLDLEPGGSEGIAAKLLIENKGQEMVSVWKTMGANGLIISPEDGELVVLPEGISEVVSANIHNHVEIHGKEAGLPMEPMDAISIIRVFSDHVQQRHGNEELRTLTLFVQEQDGGKEPIMLTLSRPWPIQENENVGEGYTVFRFIPLISDEIVSDTVGKVVAENSQYQAKVERILVGRDAISLCFEICNMTDSPLNIRLMDPQINDRQASFILLERKSFAIPANSTWVDLVTIYASDMGEKERITDLSMTVISSEQATAEPFRVTLLTPPDPLQELGTMIEMDQVEVVKSVGPEPSIEEGNQPLRDEILLPENPASYLRWIDSGLNETQNESISSGTAFVLRPGYSEGNWEVLSMQPMTQNEDGLWGAVLPGFLMCAEDEPGDICFMNVLQCDEGICKGGNSAGITFLNWETGPKMYTLGELEFTVDYRKGEAAFTSMKAEDEPFEHLFDYQEAEWFAAERTYAELESGEPDALWNWAPGSQVIAYYQMMDGTPLQMMMRPITEDDGVMILFSITEKDGKEYSLPMIPW